MPTQERLLTGKIIDDHFRKDYDGEDIRIRYMYNLEPEQAAFFIVDTGDPTASEYKAEKLQDLLYRGCVVDATSEERYQIFLWRKTYAEFRFIPETEENISTGRFILIGKRFPQET